MGMMCCGLDVQRRRLDFGSFLFFSKFWWLRLDSCPLSWRVRLKFGTYHFNVWAPFFFYQFLLLSFVTLLSPLWYCSSASYFAWTRLYWPLDQDFIYHIVNITSDNFCPYVKLFINLTFKFGYSVQKWRKIRNEKCF